jgi:hypothetical protein
VKRSDEDDWKQELGMFLFFFFVNSLKDFLSPLAMARLKHFRGWTKSSKLIAHQN